MLVFTGLIALVVVGGRMALAGSAGDNGCTLVVPADPLSAKGLATPYELLDCHESNPETAAFVQGTVFDPSTGSLSVYNPLVVDRGKRPAVPPVRPRLPQGAVVGLWFGFNGDTLKLRATDNSLVDGRCVTGLRKSAFGQFAYCNAPAFFEAASAAADAGRLRIPPVGTAFDGKPCPTVRDFGLVDMDQSDNVTSTYLFLRDGSTAQNTAANQAALASAGARILLNGSDNALLNDFVDPALGCVPFTAPDLAQPGRFTTALALNELQAARFQGQPAALVPTIDPMVLVNGKTNVAKTNLYRAGVGQPPVSTADTPEAYCKNLADIGPARIQLDRKLTQRSRSPNLDEANNLFTFLALRLAGAFDDLGCGKILHRDNPVTVITDKHGVAVNARFAHAVQAASPAAPRQLRTATVAPTPGKSRSGSPSPAPRNSATSKSPTPAPTGVGDVPPAAPSVSASASASDGGDQQPAGDLGTPQLPPSASPGPPAVTAPDRRLTSGSQLPTGTIAGVVLAVAGVLLTLAFGFKLKLPRRRYRHSSSWSPRY